MDALNAQLLNCIHGVDMQLIHSWLSFEVGRLIATGVDRQAAIIRVAAMVAMNRDQIAYPTVAVGLVEFILSEKHSRVSD